MLACIFNRSISKKIFFIFTLFIFLQCKCAQLISNVDRDRYIEEIKNEMWKILENYGLSNLPVPDNKFYYNVTKPYFGYKMVGYLYLEDGFALDISNFEIDKRNSIAIANSTNAMKVGGIINMLNVAIFQDFRIDFESQSKDKDKANGSIIIKPQGFFVEFQTFQKYPQLEKESKISEIYMQKPYLEFNPDNLLTRRVRDQFKGKAYILRNMIASWKDVFTEFLKEAVDRCKFPDVKFGN